ncbi:hypothetical protein NL676_028986 [Syzygium grande]|nr:hypothetical protein NL676_028986 [Syzygium grande]
MRADRPIPPRANDDPASLPAAPPQSDWYEVIIGRCMAFAGPTILGLLMVIFLAIPAGTPPELGLNPGSSLWSLNISTSHSKLITVEYSHVKLLSSFDGQLSLSRSSLVSTFTQGPGCVTSVRAKAQSTLAIVTDLRVNGLVSMLSGAEVTIDVVAKATRRLCLGPWWVVAFDVDVSFTCSTFTAPTNGEGGGGWMILGGALSCSLDIVPQLW